MSSRYYSVYIHTSPSGKRYVGRTSDIKSRWGYHGENYSTNVLFYSDIEKYGWNNFKHEIIKENMSKQDADKLESYLIDKYHTTDEDCGYNQISGRHTCMWIHKDDVETYIDKKVVSPYLNQGWKLGRSGIRDTYLHRELKSIKVPHSDVDTYLAEGWEIGRPEETIKYAKECGRRVIWIYDNKTFISSYELADYLRANGYPRIVQSTVHAIYTGKICPTGIYQSLIGKISTEEYIHES